MSIDILINLEARKNNTYPLLLIKILVLEYVLDNVLIDLRNQCNMNVAFFLFSV